jgi:hypothetical protein
VASASSCTVTVTSWQDAKAGTVLHELGDVVREQDLAALPAPLAGYLRAGALGGPQPHSLYATFSGRIRSGADQPWMPSRAVR